MTDPQLEDVEPGWKVYAGGDELGKVDAVDEHELVVSKGLLVKHTYHVPAEFIEEVSPGVVDLKVDRQTIENLQHQG
jgi:hypothetical protein